MSCYEPCPACNRHVVTDETTCPFCAAPLPECFSEVKRKPLRGRTSRAGLLAAGAGAALIGAWPACSTPVYGSPAGSAGTSGSMSAGAAGADGGAVGGGGGAPVAEYGAPPSFFEDDSEPTKR
jgi:hypothetical protein